MSTSMILDRTSFGVPGVPVPNFGSAGVSPSTGVPVGSNYLMVPRCSYKIEKISGGLKITCTCDDKVACSMVQNLCTMLAGGLCSCCVTLNGTTVCYCNLNVGICKCETTETGCCVTCTSGDSQCCEMIQACCDCINTLLSAGCNCCLLINNTPVCCGCVESSKKATAKSRS